MNSLERQIANIERDLRTKLKREVEALQKAMTPANSAQIQAQIDRITAATQQAIRDQRTLAEESYEYQRSFASGWENAFRRYSESARNNAQLAEDIFTQTTQGLEDAIVNFAKTGEFSLKSLGQQVAETFLRGNIRQLFAGVGDFFGLGDLFGGGGNSASRGQSANAPLYVQEVSGGGLGGINDLINRTVSTGDDFGTGVLRNSSGTSGGFGNIIDAVSGAFGGSTPGFGDVGKVVNSVSNMGSGIINTVSNIASGIGDFFGGFFANGGFLPAGKFGIAGERGPELITGPANITPGAMGSSPVNLTINAVDAPSFQALVARDPAFIYAVAQQGALAR